VSSRPAPEPGARRSLRARLAAGPLARRIGIADVRLYTLVRRDLRLPGAERAARAYTTAGEHAAAWYLLGLAGALLDPPRASRWRRAMAGVLVTQLVNTAIKALVRRRRPALDGLPALVRVPTSLSFPSAHASTSFAAARGFGPLMRSPRPLYLAAAAMALSRVYLGVHYPSDIAAGAGLGVAIGSAAR
jgi:membrane-associated phospholipid phosphatase